MTDNAHLSEALRERVFRGRRGASLAVQQLQAGARRVPQAQHAFLAHHLYITDMQKHWGGGGGGKHGPRPRNTGRGMKKAKAGETERSVSAGAVWCGTGCTLSTFSTLWYEAGLCASGQAKPRGIGLLQLHPLCVRCLNSETHAERERERRSFENSHAFCPPGISNRKL